LKVAVVLPAYNEEKMLGWVIQGIQSLNNSHHDYEIIVIDDGSIDRTVQIAKSSGADFIHSHTQNYGLGASIWSGIQLAIRKDFEAICIIDADGQFFPTDIPVILKPIQNGEADLVLGVRFEIGSGKRMISKIKLVGNKIFSLLVSVITLNRLNDTQTGFRALSMSSAKALELRGKHNCSQEMILDLSFKGFRIKEVPINVQYFADRKSRVVKKTWMYILRVISLIVTRILLVPWIQRGIILTLGSVFLTSIFLALLG
jgi:glycosyltransferase involved in cell wall biosynthesis